MTARRRLAAVPDRPSRYVAYVRVSALMGRSGEDFHSPDLQLAAIRRHAAPLGLTEIAVVDDDIDVSGRTFSRRGLDKVRTMVEAGQVDTVAVYELSRLGRNAGEALRFIRWLREHGVGLVSTVEKIDDSPEGQFILTQFLALAELYSNQIGRRWGELISYRVRQGYHNGGPPMGYVRDKATKNIVPDPVIGPVITEAFQAFAAGVPIAEIARRISAARGTPTHVSTVKRVLFNPVYVGKVALYGIGRHKVPSVHDVPLYVGDGLHQPLTDPDTFDACIARHKRDARTAPRLLNPSNPLVGLLVCQHCEHAMQMHMERGRQGKPDVARMRCGLKAAAQGCAGPGQPALNACVDAVLDKVRQHVRRLRGDVAAQAAAAGRQARAGADRTALERELTETRSALGKLTQGWATGRVPDAAYAAAVGPLEAAERELATRLDDVSQAAGTKPPNEQANLAEELLALWPEMTTSERNRALKQVVRRATIRASTSYREPPDARIEVEFW